MKVSVVYAEYYYGKGRAKVIDIRDKKSTFSDVVKMQKSCHVVDCIGQRPTETNLKGKSGKK